ncbi:MAG: nickel ABC transporter, nickel/metallophore periplasmic binding protein [Campylobacterales bacterium]|nr:nickel ABC transporter, nickel/metallophore periplasmic binding protein [Campylobacterales bacterium]
MMNPHKTFRLFLASWLMVGVSLWAVPSTTLVYASTKDIRDINPHLYGGEMAAQNMVFEPLLLNTREGLKPWLAERWEVSKDTKTYTFFLREDVVFSDGTPFDAKVVKQNIDAVLSNFKRHAWLELVNQIDKSEVVDAYTYRLTLKNAYYPALEELALTRPFRFLSPKCFQEGETKGGVSCLVGTGPWVLSEHRRNQFAHFEANPTYWGKKPLLQGVRWRVMPEHQSILLALQKGEIDLLFGADGDMVDLDSFAALERQGRYRTLMSQPIASRAVLINSNQPITSDINVRQALQYAINKEAIAKGIFNGSEVVAHTLFSPTTPYCDVELPSYMYDPVKANTLLEKAGWVKGKDPIRTKEGKPLVLEISFNAQNAQERAISEYLQSNLKTVGVELRIVGEEKQSFLDRQQSGNFDLQYSLSWGVPYDPQSYISSWRIPAHGDFQAQRGLPKKAWLDETITRVLIEPDSATRHELYAQMLRYIHSQYVYIPLTYSRTKAVFSPKVQGVEFSLSQYEIPFERMSLSR